MTLFENQAASSGKVSDEKYSKFLTDSQIGERVYGVIRSTIGNTDSAMSNAGQAIFLDAQQVASPIEKQSIQDGRPILTWTPLSGVSGYLYFVCDRPCTQNGATYLWTNYPNLTISLSAIYPNTAKALPSGTHYWWVAGVRQENGKAVSLSYSEQRSFVVP